MKPTDRIILTAFLTALQKLDEPLPNYIQLQLNQIGESLKVNPNNIGNLDLIAKSHPPLNILYQQEFTVLRQKTTERGSKPLSLPNDPTPELTNATINTFSNKNSVSAAQENVKPNLLQRMKNFIAGGNANE
ncbi:MAG: hypothetical protein QNJ47_03285 [Nostocaceae cyanobacterium]|nr:hypothetical protein [Nostocaceae cyanobacterium]